ncbi:MAG TPA: type II toxin-antitoxin system VapC family toxin [Pseudonocardiaceae bacterium]|nr:type II toxin-antitoxin system VapC family toxin [Pseudonocardiaceae bacterium]
MRLLLDSHVVLWSLQRPERLPKEAVAAITDPVNSVDVSVASLWELAIKQSLGKLRVDGDLREHLTLQSFSELPVLGEHALAVRDLPRHHRDPFDRLLIAQARCEGLTIVTADRAFAAYDVPIMPA